MIETLPQPRSNSRDAAGSAGKLFSVPSAPVAASGSSAMGQLPRTIQRAIRDDRICVLTFDRAGSAANIFDRRTLMELGEEIDFIAASSQLKGVILASAKRSIFIAGADLHLMQENASPQDIRDFVELGQGVMNRLAALQIPTVAAIHGAIMGWPGAFAERLP